MQPCLSQKSFHRSRSAGFNRCKELCSAARAAQAELSSVTRRSCDSLYKKAPVSNSYKLHTGLSHVRLRSSSDVGFSTEPSCLHWDPLFLQYLTPNAFFGNAKNLHDIKMHVPLGFPVNSFSFFSLFSFFFLTNRAQFYHCSIFFFYLSKIFSHSAPLLRFFSFITLWQMKVKRSNY